MLFCLPHEAQLIFVVASPQVDAESCFSAGPLVICHSAHRGRLGCPVYKQLTY